MAEPLQIKDFATLNSPALNRAIQRVETEFNGAVLQTPMAPDHSLFGREVLRTQGLLCDASAACAVLNAIRCLGIDPKQEPEALLEKLAQKHLRPQVVGFAMMEEKGGIYFPNPYGIVNLFTMAERPGNQSILEILVRRAKDMGQAHDYLAHGYTAVAVDERTAQAVAVVGMKQVNGEATWFVTPSSGQMEEAIVPLSDHRLRLTNQDVNTHGVDPQNLASRFRTPIWVVGRE